MGRTVTKSIAIIGEGETEWFYFDSLRIACRYPFKVAPDFPQHSDIKHILKLVESYLNKQYDYIVCLFDMDRLYQALDVFFMPSLFEGLPVAGIEAQASDLNCIFSDTISEELRLIPKVKYLSFDDNINVWVDAILNTKVEDRENRHRELEHNGYDTKIGAEKLMYKYYELLKIYMR